MLLVRNWLVTFWGYWICWQMISPRNRPSLFCGAWQRRTRLFPVEMENAATCNYTISQPTSTHHWLTMLNSCWMCQCGSRGVHSIVTYHVIIWNVFIFHILSPNEFTCFFFVKIISQEQFCFLTPKNSLLGAHFGHFSRAIFGQAHKRAIQAAARGDLAALGLKLWIFSRLLTVKGKPFIKIYAGCRGIWVGNLDFRPFKFEIYTKSLSN